MIWKIFLFITLISVFATIPAPANNLSKSLPTGTWGGKHIRLDVLESGATVEYDCAFGTIDEPLLLDENNHLKALGTYVFERGGPRQIGEPPPKKHAALYCGWTDGHQMRLTVKLSETQEVVGTFSLCLGCPPRLEKCL